MNKNLIEWSKQYIKNGGDFVDIGSSDFTWSLLLRNICRNLFCFDEQDIPAPNDPKIKFHNVKLDNEKNKLDGYSFEDVELIHINVKEAQNIIRGTLNFLARNKYPYLIINCRDIENVKTLLLSLGYFFHKISGSENYYLFSDNKQRQSYERELVFSNIASLEKGEVLSPEKMFSVAEYYKNTNTEKLKIFLDTHGTKFIPLEKIFSFIDVNSQLAEKLVLSKELSWDKKQDVLKRYAEKSILKLPLEKSTIIHFPLPSGYKQSSPSLFPTPTGFIYNIRGVNYSINSDGSYKIRDPQGVVRTKNFLLHLTEDLNLTKVVPLVEDFHPGTAKYQSHIEGLEDLRLFSESEFFCTSLNFNEGRKPQVCHGKFNEEGKVYYINPLPLFGQIEKNWLPFYKNEELLFIYSWQPLKVYSVKNGGLILVVEKEISKHHDLSGFRGSACPIRFPLGEKLGWLCTIHEVIYGAPRKYFHRFLWFSDDFTEIKCSSLFYFFEVAIEFNLSITRKNDNLLICHSFEDNEGYLSQMKESNVVSLLNQTIE